MLEKSASYVRTAQDKTGKRIGCVFLVEAALGDVHQIAQDDSSFVAAPKGKHSVQATGRINPDPSKHKTIKLDGKDVTVQIGTAVPQHASSSFQHDEFLVYKENQQRLRYILTFKY